MSEFVEQCRQEWRRLNVPDPLTEEIAADLASDLGEAEAEGVTAEELLGSSALIRGRSLPPGQPSEGSSPNHPAEETRAADRDSSWRSPPLQRSP